VFNLKAGNVNMTAGKNFPPKTDVFRSQHSIHTPHWFIHQTGVQKMETLQIAVTRSNKAIAPHVDNNKVSQPTGHRDMLTCPLTTFASSCFDSQHASVSLAPSTLSHCHCLLLHLSSYLPHTFLMDVSMPTVSFVLASSSILWFLQNLLRSVYKWVIFI
jgi:hypothetical protein